MAGTQWIFNSCFIEGRKRKKGGKGEREGRAVHLSNREGPAPLRELLLQKRWKEDSKNAAAFAQSFNNPLEAAWVEPPMVPRHWPTPSFPDHELPLPFSSESRDFSFVGSGFLPWEVEGENQLIQK